MRDERLIEGVTRRDVLLRVGGGAGAIAMAAMGGGIGEARAANYQQNREIDLMRPLVPREGHFTGKAKRILWLFQYGVVFHQIDAL